jgi:uncharacterized protein (DUF885 family)
MDVNGLADELVTVLFDATPWWATLAGIPGWDDRLGDPSEAADAEVVQRLAAVRAAAEAIDPATLEAADRITRDVVIAVCADEAATYTTATLEWQVTDTHVAAASGLLVYLPEATVRTAEQAADYRTRLAAVGPYLDAVAARHLDALDTGRLPVACLVQNAIAQLDRHLAAPDDDPFRAPVATLDGAAGEQARSDVDGELAASVRPALRRYRDLLAERVLPAGRDDDHPGLCHLPGGDEIYRTLVRVHTTSDRDPEDLHRTGLALIEALSAEYAELGQRVFGSSDEVEVRRRLREDPALRCESAEQMLTEARAAVERAEAAVPAWFAHPPEQRCQVRAVPEAEQDRAPGAYYFPGALDGSRPGVYFQNTRTPAEQHWYTLQNAAFHEGVPGHHMQAAAQLAQADLPRLRKLYQFNGYDEGWGLYSERLADEMGLFSSDLARFGMLAGDSVRSARLVVDTGLHAMGWTRAQALDYMIANTPWPENDVRVEVDRYIANPGQALAYMVGRLEIQRLRASAAERLGPAFDIRSFHDVVLALGSSPLSLLARRIDEWVTEVAAGA